MKTNSILKLTVGLAAILFSGQAQIHAATTNSVQNIEFELTFFTQGPTNHPSTNITTVTINKFRATTRDVIAALGQATSNHFSRAAKLVSVRDATSTNSSRVIEVRDGTNVVDVTGYFHLTAAETNLLSVHSLFYNSVTGNAFATRDGIFHLSLSNSNMTADLDLSGFATTTTAVFKCGTNFVNVDEIDADVAGSGMGTNGVPAVVKGQIEIEGRVIRTE
jgi:hypothetical protein